jgi:hypothetical protein
MVNDIFGKINLLPSIKIEKVEELKIKGNSLEIKFKDQKGRYKLEIDLGSNLKAQYRDADKKIIMAGLVKNIKFKVMTTKKKGK